MAWTAEQIQDFLSDNPGTSEALQTVMDASNDGDDEVEWKDVKDEDGMDSGRWG